MNQKTRQMSELRTWSVNFSRYLMNKGFCDEKCLGMCWVKQVFVLSFDQNIFTLLIYWRLSWIPQRQMYDTVFPIHWPGPVCSLKQPLGHVVYRIAFGNSKSGKMSDFKEKNIESQEVKRWAGAVWPCGHKAGPGTIQVAQFVVPHNISHSPFCSLLFVEASLDLFLELRKRIVALFSLNSSWTNLKTPLPNLPDRRPTTVCF